MEKKVPVLGEENTNRVSNSRKNEFKRVNRNLIGGLLTLLLVTSCNSHEVLEPINKGEKDGVEVIFTTEINNPGTRAAGTIWHAGDQIGLFAFNHDETLTFDAIYDNNYNIQYVNDIEGATANFTPVDKKIMFPGTKDYFDFVAYYPFSTSDIVKGEDGVIKLNIDISNQTSFRDIDIMYAKATEYNRNNPNVELVFNHRLSMLEMLLTTDEDVDLNDAEIEIEGVLTEAVMEIADGSIDNGVKSSIITPISTYKTESNSLTVRAFLLPDQKLNDIDVKIVTINGNQYIWNPIEYTMKSGTIRQYNLKLNASKVEMVGEGITITDWEYDVNDDTLILDVIGDDSESGDGGDDGTGDEDEDGEGEGELTGGDGTIDNPYTVQQAIEKQGETEVWVQGYIVGWLHRNDTESEYILKSSDEIPEGVYIERIAIADNLLENDVSKILQSRLVKDGVAFNDLNLKTNTDKIGKKVKMLSNLEKYFDLPSAINISQYEFIN